MVGLGGADNCGGGGDSERGGARRGGERLLNWRTLMELVVVWGK